MIYIQNPVSQDDELPILGDFYIHIGAPPSMQPYN